MIKPLVYIASPYTKGDVGINVRFQCQMWNQLTDDGLVVPYAPLWSHFQHLHDPRPYDFWLNACFDIIPHCQALIRFGASDALMDYYQWESTGADKEEDLADKLNIPRFRSKGELYRWVKEVYHAK